MKASEVLQRYAAGERNFQRVNLRGVSFKGEILAEADFSEADLRSANFTGANLRGAIFTGAQCGLQKRWATVLVVLSWLLAAISGFFSIFLGAIVSLIFDSSLENQIGGWASLIVLVVFLVIMLRHGIIPGVVAVAVAGAYISWRAMKGDPRDPWVRSFAVAVAAIGGTSFRGADLTEANLTGAYIEDWGITSQTIFHGVRCEYVYMRLPTADNPQPCRKPDNDKEVFADGDFGDFIQPIVDTLDLYHNQEVDPRAIAISFKELAEKHPDAELEIVAMERKGDGQLRRGQAHIQEILIWLAIAILMLTKVIITKRLKEIIYKRIRRIKVAISITLAQLITVEQEHLT